METAAARAAVNEAALARDPVAALLAAAVAMPATEAFAYERHRARSYAHALTGAEEAALAELALATAAAASAGVWTLASDTAHLHLLLEEPCRRSPRRRRSARASWRGPPSRPR